MMTLKQIMAAIERGNKGVRARYTGKSAFATSSCVYATIDGNHCAIGCFIPSGHIGHSVEGDAHILLKDFPDLLDHMPSKNFWWLIAFQLEHDRGNDDGTLHHALALWLLLNPPPDAPANYFEGVVA